MTEICGARDILLLIAWVLFSFIYAQRAPEIAL